MAVSAHLYCNFVSNVLGGMTAGETQRMIDWLSDTIKVMLTTSGYVPNQDTHKFKSDITNELPATGGYVAGGTALAGKTIVLDTVNNIMTLDANDVTWAASTLTNARVAVIYDDRAAAAADKELIGYVDFGADTSSAGVDFTIQWSAQGVVQSIVA